MMKVILCALALLPLVTRSQTDPHTKMFETSENGK